MKIIIFPLDFKTEISQEKINFFLAVQPAVALS